jgi:hypothetical protein
MEDTSTKARVIKILGKTGQQIYAYLLAQMFFCSEIYKKFISIIE